MGVGRCNVVYGLSLPSKDGTGNGSTIEISTYLDGTKLWGGS